MKISKIMVLCIVMVLICKHEVLAQDTLKITIEQAEKQFLEKNLQLLAEHYNIDIADAAVAQAKLLNNPTISVNDINFWHSNAAEELGVPPNFGNKIAFSAQLEQIFRTAGKRRKFVDVQKVSKEMAVQEFEAFLLGLKTELQTILNEIIYLQSYADIIHTQLKSVDNLIESYKKQTLSGNIAKGELLRLQSSLIELDAENNDVQTELNRQYKDIKVLLNITDATKIFISDTNSTAKNPDEISLMNLLETAKNLRPEFLLSDLGVRYHEKLLRYEKAQRSPDLGINLNYDRYGGVWKNFFGIGISVDIPVFNRNQGNIKIAKLQLQQSNYNAEQQKNRILQDIVEIYDKYKMNYNFYKKLVDNDFSEDMDNMMEVYSRNFLNRNISMLEFIDFMSSYKTTKQAILTAKKNLDNSFAELQFSINSIIN
ncbi:MAG: TolC family protein [Paludibacter sp.]|nr:TolC family protein [Paludibacter sp.]